MLSWSIAATTTAVAIVSGARVAHAVAQPGRTVHDLVDLHRLHRIVNVANVALIQERSPAFDGGMLVRLKDEKMTELSVARDRNLKARLGTWCDHVGAADGGDSPLWPRRDDYGRDATHYTNDSHLTVATTVSASQVA